MSLFILTVYKVFIKVTSSLGSNGFLSRLKSYKTTRPFYIMEKTSPAGRILLNYLYSCVMLGQSNKPAFVKWVVAYRSTLGTEVKL